MASLAAQAKRPSIKKDKLRSISDAEIEDVMMFARQVVRAAARTFWTYQSSGSLCRAHVRIRWIFALIMSTTRLPSRLGPSLQPFDRVQSKTVV